MGISVGIAAVGGGILVILLIASIIGAILARTARSERGRATVANLNARVRAWWLMCIVVFAAVIAGPTTTTILFALLSFLALREFITLTPTRRSDHHTLFWAFFVVVPLQYWFVAMPWFGMLSIFIPVWVFLFVSIRGTLSGDHRDYLERTAKIQWGLMICVYCVSHIPALLSLEIPGYAGRNAELVLFLVAVAQLSDVFQYVWGKLLGRRKIAPHLSPNKTWEGFIGGVATATGVGAALWWMTPFTPTVAAGMALGITLMGFAGGIVMSAIKRDAGVKDFGATIAGHGGILDRIDSLCFSAPVLFHLVRFYYTP
ncbi:MAG: phosphatidate cytidylyltransferase [Planctomycetes bacterium]|nr:phosphatidate cytidylyltransferase [Planctomycetota bacterium]